MISVLSTASCFSTAEKRNPGEKRKLVAIKRENHEENPGKIRRGAEMFLEYKMILSSRCRKKSGKEWRGNCPRTLAEQRVAFARSLQILWIYTEPTSMGSLRIHSGDTPKLT